MLRCNSAKHDACQRDKLLIPESLGLRRTVSGTVVAKDLFGRGDQLAIVWAVGADRAKYQAMYLAIIRFANPQNNVVSYQRDTGSLQCLF
jgi:hypothetical protein